MLRTTLNLLLLHGFCFLLGWARSLVPEISDHHGCFFAFRSNYTTTKPNTINQTPREATNLPPLICTTHVRKLRRRPCTNKNCWFAAYDRIAIFCSASHASDRAVYRNATVSSGPPGSEISYWYWDGLPQGIRLGQDSAIGIGATVLASAELAPSQALHGDTGAHGEVEWPRTIRA